MRALVEGWFGATQLVSWARLLKRVFEFDLAHCPNCGGELKIIAAILEALVVLRAACRAFDGLARLQRRQAKRELGCQCSRSG